MKRTTIWAVERTDWYGECEDVQHFDSEAEAEAFAKQLRRESRAVDDPRDKIRYSVYSMVWERED